MIFAMLVVLGSAAAVSAGERGKAISSSNLSSMGLSTLQQVGDSEGLTVRGKGTFAFVSGSGSANLFGLHQSSNYAAGATHYSGSSLAVGADVNVVGVGGKIGPVSGFIVAGAVGGSFAYAK